METAKTLFCAIIQDDEQLTYESPLVEHYYAEDRYAVKDHITWKLAKQWELDTDDVEANFEIIVIEVQDFEIETI